MLNNFLSSQNKFNENEKARIDKITKKIDKYEKKKVKIVEKYNHNNLIKKFYNIEFVNTYEEMVKEIILSKNIHKYDDIDIKYNNINNKIILTYQYNYKNNEKVTGFGDFIRGCYFLLQFSEKNDLMVDFHINCHPIKNYLEYFINKPDLNEDISCKIQFFKLNNANYMKSKNIITYDYIDINNEFIKHPNTEDSVDNNIYIFLINHPDEIKLTNSHKEKIKQILKPTCELNNLVETALTRLKLVKNQFIVIHIRLDDSCFEMNFTSINSKKIYFLLNYINQIKQSSEYDIFLLSSCNYIKQIILKYIPNIKTIFNQIDHICNTQLDENSIINTLKEFYIMTYSNSIFSFSVYPHGSGFSKWCAVTYNIPYVCYFLE